MPVNHNTPVNPLDELSNEEIVNQWNHGLIHMGEIQQESDRVDSVMDNTSTWIGTRDPSYFIERHFILEDIISGDTVSYR